mgnify:CR=1 FL=1
MSERDVIEGYKKQIEILLRPLYIVKVDTVVNKDSETNAKNKNFIKEKMNRIYGANVDEKLMNQAIDELLPYLIEVN